MSSPISSSSTDLYSQYDQFYNSPAFMQNMEKSIANTISQDDQDAKKANQQLQNAELGIPN